MLNLPCYTKYEALHDIFVDRGHFSSWPSKKVSALSFLKVISEKDYNLKQELEVTAATVARISSLAFPDKTRTNARICGFLLATNGYQQCAKCETVLPKKDFHDNASKLSGKQSYCRLCFNDTVRDYRKYYVALHRASKIQRTPKWANLQGIREFYAQCP